MKIGVVANVLQDRPLEDALKTFAESHEVTLEEFQRKSFLVRTFMGALKLFAPLL